MPDFAEMMGPSYTIQNALSVECERTVNWRLERVSSGQGKNQFALLREPGLQLFCNTSLGDVRVRGVLSLNGHMYGVVGSHVLEFFADGTFTDYSLLFGVYPTDDNKKVWMAASPDQILIVSGGNGYVLGAPGGLVQVASPDFPSGSAAACSFQDGYFIVTITDSQQFQISAINDAYTWDASKVSEVESRPDFLVAPIFLKEETWFFGTQTIQPYFNNGDPDFPFAPNQSAIINSGLMAPESLVRIGNTLFWLKIDENGHGTFCRNDGYLDVEISNHAVESTWNTYDNLEDSYAWAFQENGHECVRLSFTTTNAGSGTATWQYDLSTGQWTEVSWFNEDTGLEEAHRGYCCCVAFDKILVGDRNNGKIYEMKATYLDDDGYLIRRVRRAPHLYNNKRNIFYHDMEFDGNTGIGWADAPLWTSTLPLVDVGGVLNALLAAGTATISQVLALFAAYNNTLAFPYTVYLSLSRANLATALTALEMTVTPDPFLYVGAYDPQMVVRLSDDGARTFGPDDFIGFGKAGEYYNRPIKSALGAARDRVVEIEVTAAVDWALAACRLDYTIGKN